MTERRRKTWLQKGILDPRLIVTVGLLSAHVAQAGVDPKSRAAADALFEQAKASLKAGDWAAACSRFQQSFEFDASPSTLVKIARCHEHNGELTAAKSDYERAQTMLTARPASDKHARALEVVVSKARQDVEARLAWVTLDCSPKVGFTTVTIDKRSLSNAETSAPLAMDPGDHVVTVAADTYMAEPVKFTLKEGEHRSLVIQLTPLESSKTTPTGNQPTDAHAAQPGEVQPAAQPTTQPSAPSTNRVPAPSAERNRNTPAQGRTVVAYVTGGSGILFLGASAYFGLKTRSSVNAAHENNHCDSNDACDLAGLNLLDQARHEQTWSIVFATGGTLMLGTSIILWATTPKARAKSAQLTAPLQLRLSPTGASIGGSF